MKLWSSVVSANAWIFSCGTSIQDEGPNSLPTSMAVMAQTLRDLHDSSVAPPSVIRARTGRKYGRSREIQPPSPCLGSESSSGRFFDRLVRLVAELAAARDERGTDPLRDRLLRDHALRNVSPCGQRGHYVQQRELD